MEEALTVQRRLPPMSEACWDQGWELQVEAWGERLTCFERRLVLGRKAKRCGPGSQAEVCHGDKPRETTELAEQTGVAFGH